MKMYSGYLLITLIIFYTSCKKEDKILLKSGLHEMIMAKSGSGSIINLKQGLMAYYPFNGNVNDYSGNNRNGILNGGVSLTSDRYGRDNSAYLFNGVDGFIAVPDLNTSPYSPVTYSAWVLVSTYFTSPEPGHKFKTVIGRQTCGVANAGAIGFFADGNIDNGLHDNQFLMWRGGGVYPDPPVSKIKPRLNKWTHITWTQNSNGNWQWYINGTLSNEGNFTNPLDYFDFFRIGGCNCGTTTFWDNKIDEVRIYDRVLTEKEIKYLSTH